MKAGLIGVGIATAALVLLMIVWSATFSGSDDTAKAPESIEDFLKLQNQDLRTELKTKQAEIERLKEGQAGSAMAESLKKDVEKMLAEVETLKIELLKREADLKARQEAFIGQQGEFQSDLKRLGEDQQKLKKDREEINQRIKNEIEDLKKLKEEILLGMERKGEDEDYKIVEEMNRLNRLKNKFVVRQKERELADLRRRNAESRRKAEERYDTEIAWLEAKLRA